MQLAHLRSPRRRGNALLEGALITPVFLMMFFGIVDFSRAVFAYNSIAYAAQEGVRYASVHGTQSGAEADASMVQNVVFSKLVGMNGTNTTVRTTWAGTKLPGQFVTVTVRHTFNPIVPFVPQQDWALTGAASLPISQ